MNCQVNIFNIWFWLTLNFRFYLTFYICSLKYDAYTIWNTCVIQEESAKIYIFVQCETWQLCNMEYDTRAEYDTCAVCNVTNMQSEMWHLYNMEYYTWAFWNMIHVEYGICTIWIVILVRYGIWLFCRNITLGQYWNNIALI